MAKKSKEGFGAGVDEVFDLIDSINPEASFLDQSTLSKVTKWIDTGCYALNAICSGSLYKGIPSGRITGFSGPQACGKTFIINKIFANAQKAGRFAVCYDTEVAVDEATAVNVGADPKRIKHVPIETIGEARNQLNKFLDSVIEKKLQGKFIACIDSLGNLISEKEKKDIEEGKDAMDMGIRAKCLSGETKVATSLGEKKLQDIEVGDDVLTHLNRYRPVKHKWTNNHKKYIVVKVKDQEIKMSIEHQMLVKRNGKLQYIEAQNLNTSDKLISLT